MIRAEHLSKQFRLGSGGYWTATLRDAVADRARDSVSAAAAVLARRPRVHRREPRTLWALDDVSFEVEAGDALGVIGRNGAGKSTLLKILSRITEPTSGRVGVNGRVGSLLEVGTGFHPELTGRENIFLYGSILGMRRTEIGRRFDEIVAFAEVEDFLDTPIKRYSSGMQVRLAFAVAAHLEPDILLVDEVLAVGDVAFQKKCLGRMEDVAGRGRTVIFVSHNMAVVQALCKRGLFLDHGNLRFDGSIQDAVALYLRDLDEAMTVELGDRTDRRGYLWMRLTRVDIVGGGHGGGGLLMTGSPATFTFHVDGEFLPSTTCAFTVYDQFGHPVAEFSSDVDSPADSDDGETGQFTCVIDELPLVPGRYRVDALITAQALVQDAIQGVTSFDVEPGVLSGRPVEESGRLGPVAIRHRWKRPSIQT